MSVERSNPLLWHSSPRAATTTSINEDIKSDIIESSTIVGKWIGLSIYIYVAPNASLTCPSVAAVYCRLQVELLPAGEGPMRCARVVVATPRDVELACAALGRREVAPGGVRLVVEADNVRDLGELSMGVHVCLGVSRWGWMCFAEYDSLSVAISNLL